MSEHVDKWTNVEVLIEKYAALLRALEIELVKVREHIIEHGHRVFGDASLTCSDCPGEIGERGHRRDLSFTMTFKVTAKARNVHSAAADQGRHWP
jgi:hypothetical protein